MSGSNKVEVGKNIALKEAKSAFMPAFIVKTQSCFNFDIDLDIKETLAAGRKISTGAYVYVQDGKTYDGITYRCRLKDVLVNNRHMHSTFLQAKTLVNQYIDRSNGWVLARVDGVDIYDRLLVTLCDIFTKEDLKDILIASFDTILQKHQTRF